MMRHRSLWRLCLLTVVFGVSFSFSAAEATTGPPRTIRVNVSSAGVQANNLSSGTLSRPAVTSVSADGRYVAFTSSASNLVRGDTNGVDDVFVRDVATGRTRRVSVSSSGAQANDSSGAPAISADGRYVAFQSDATNLVPGTTLPAHDAVFVRDVATGRTRRVSVSSTGMQANADSRAPAISAYGRYVTFHTFADNLVPDTNGSADVFVHDLVTGQTQRVSVDSAGAEADNASFDSSISGDGRYVAFNSDATNLVPGDINQATDTFVHDMVTGQTQRVNVDSAAAQADAGFGPAPPAISEDGRYVAFDSDATNLVPGDTNDARDVFVHDLVTGQTQRVSVDSAGAQSDGGGRPAISGDGRYVAFASGAANLVPGDTNSSVDVFVHDLVTGQTRRVSVNSAGAQANGSSANGSGDRPAISANGRYVAFTSDATNLVPGDTNGFTDVFRRDRVR